MLRQKRIELKKAVDRLEAKSPLSDQERHDLAVDRETLAGLEADIEAEEERLAAEKARVAGGEHRGIQSQPLGTGATTTALERGSYAAAISELMPAPLSGTQRDEASAELVRAVVSGGWNSRVFAGQSTTIGSEGGFAVRPEVARTFWDTAGGESVSFSWFRVEPMRASEKIVPMLDDFDRSGDEVASLEGQWVGEGSTITADTAKLAKIHLHARKTAVLVEVPRELLDDAEGRELSREFGRAMSNAIRLKVDKACLNNGTGAGQPLSILNSDALISITRDSAGTVTHTDVVTMISRLPAESQGRYVWIGSPSVIPKLYTLSYAIGTGGAAPPVFTQLEDGTFRLFGRPMAFSPRLPALGTVGDLLAVDPTQYLVGLRTDIQLARSDHYAFNRDVIALRATIRMDGQPAWKSARTDEDGTTRSPFVAIAT